MDKTVAEFFKTEIPSFAAYDNVRKCASYIDGFKNSMRKLYYSGMKFCADDYIKTENFSNYSAAYTNYLHGSGNLSGVAVTMVQGFVGANNFPLFVGNTGGWGSRIVPRASAPRYTKLKLSQNAKKFFNSVDMEVVGNQIFEGSKIEPKFFVPVLPMILLNGSEGISSGFSQRILPRHPKAIIEYIKKRIEGKEKAQFDDTPWFRGFKGSFKKCEDGKIEILGNVTKSKDTLYTIDEIPIGVSYTSYISTLDKLVDDKVIVDYYDKCDTKSDTICFEIKTTRAFTEENPTIEQVIKTLRLSKPYSEIFNCIDEENRMREFKSAKEVIDAFIDVRMNAYVARREHLIKKNTLEMAKLYSKFLFCAGVIKDEIQVRNKKKDQIIKQLEEYDRIIKVDDSYDYLLNMPIHSLTKEMMDSLKKKIAALKDLVKSYKEKQASDFWIEDLESLQLETK